MSSNFLALLLIFGLGHPSREPVDAAKSAQLHSRLPCDGYGAPEDLLKIKTTFSSGGSAREFTISRIETDKCSVESMFQCWHKPRTGWHDIWSAINNEPSATATIPISSCDAWGSTAPAQYILSGWYRDTASNSKDEWHQGTLKQVSAQPDVYEFTDPSGGSAHIEIIR